MEKTINKTLEAQRKRNFKGWYAGNTDEAVGLNLSVVPTETMVGLGDSSTIRRLGVVKRSKDHRNKVVNRSDITKILKDQDSYFECLLRPSLVARMKAYRDESLPRYKRPRRIIFDDVPRSLTGQVLKLELKQYDLK